MCVRARACVRVRVSVCVNYFSCVLSLAGNSSRLTWVDTATVRAPLYRSYQYVHCFCVQTMVWLPVFWSFDVHTDLDACDCTQGMYGHRKRVCTGNPLWDQNPLPHRRKRTSSALRLAFSVGCCANCRAKKKYIYIKIPAPQLCHVSGALNQTLPVSRWIFSPS